MRYTARFATIAATLLLLQGCETMGSIMPWSGKAEDLEEKADYSKLPPEQLYNNGIDALNGKRYNTAVGQFDAQLMHGYAEYLQNHYSEANGALDRFIALHPGNQNIAYAYYLRALAYYEQVSDIQRDQKGTQVAMAALQDVVNRFPDTPYARDARLKIDLCRDHLAGKEMEVGRWYEGQKNYAAAIGRFQRVVDDYQTTNHVPEALHRLTEIYLLLGLTDQARKTAAVLGHNYPGNSWYETSYNDLVDQGMAAPVPVDRTVERGGFISRTLGSIF
jgi:outer membrane protein assembly factor BamD